MRGLGNGEARLAITLAAGRLAVETAGPAAFDAVLVEATPGPAGDWITGSFFPLDGGAQLAGRLFEP